MIGEGNEKINLISNIWNWSDHVQALSPRSTTQTSCTPSTTPWRPSCTRQRPRNNKMHQTKAKKLENAPNKGQEIVVIWPSIIFFACWLMTNVNINQWNVQDEQSLAFWKRPPFSHEVAWLSKLCPLLLCTLLQIYHGSETNLFILQICVISFALFCKRMVMADRMERNSFVVVQCPYLKKK